MREDSGVMNPMPDHETQRESKGLVWLPPATTMTRTIVIANVAVFGAMVANGMPFLDSDGQMMLDWGANFGPLTMNGQWWRLGTCMFLHFGIIHLALNMWILRGLAQIVERLVGSTGFAIVYLVSGIAGSIASLAWQPVGVSAGASGAVFGTAGALLGFVVLRSDTIPKAVRYQMLKSMATFLILNLVIGMSLPQIDMAAHTGGFVAGVICGLILSQPLSQEMIARRKFKNMIALMTAAIMLPSMMAALPEALPDISARMQYLSRVENEICDTFNADQDKAFKGVIDHNEFADRIERNVLPAWIKLREEVESFLSLEHVDKDYLEILVRYIRCREDSWQLLVHGLREKDNAKIQRSLDLSEDGRRKLQEETQALREPQ